MLFTDADAGNPLRDRSDLFRCYTPHTSCIVGFGVRVERCNSIDNDDTGPPRQPYQFDRQSRPSQPNAVGVSHLPFQSPRIFLYARTDCSGLTRTYSR